MVCLKDLFKAEIKLIFLAVGRPKFNCLEYSETFISQ